MAKSTKITKLDESALESYLMDDDATVIFDILPHPIRNAYARVPEDIKMMEDADLIRAMNHISETRRGPGSRVDDRRRDIQLKHALWHEYDTAMMEKRKMMVKNIIRGILPQPQFTAIYLQDKLRVEWMMRPPNHYWNEMRILLEKSTMKIHEILDIPVVRKVCKCSRHCLCGRKGGQFSKNEEDVVCACLEVCKCEPVYDSKIAQVQQRLHESIEMRVKGAVLQRVRVDKQSLIAQIRADGISTQESNKESTESIVSTPQDIEKQLQALRGEVRKLKSGKTPDTIDLNIQNESSIPESTA